MSDKKNFLTIHGHFYQPPRENPWLESIEKQDRAAPFHDWNDKICSESYSPNSLTKIGDSAFENCKGLCAITIPKSVTEIGKQVFDITGWYQPYDRRDNGWSPREKSKYLITSCYAASSGLYYACTEGYQIKNAAK